MSLFKSREVPAFAGMTFFFVNKEIPAFAGIARKNRIINDVELLLIIYIYIYLGNEE
jgi:hypothetical protein